MPRRYFSFFLHAHLPWVLGYGRWPHGIEWVCEACVGSYIPLLRGLRRLADRGVRGGVTLSISPVLAEQLAHPRFAPILNEYIEDRIRTAGDDARRFARVGRGPLAELARRWCDFHVETLQFVRDELRDDLLGAFAELEAQGSLELATCAATHGYLPLLGHDATIALQLRLARLVHRRRFGNEPEGLWLPEMAYRPAGTWRAPVGNGDSRERAGIEQFVHRAGFRWFPVDTSLLLAGESLGAWSDLLIAAPGVRRAAWRAASPSSPHTPLHDTRRSYRVASPDPDVNTTCFVRDEGTSLQVWSGSGGYPGDGAYLEFHKKSDSGGHRYWRVTGANVELGDKEPYRPEDAAARVAAHASHFRALVTSTLDEAPDGAILVAPYDAELFGHWWFEGTAWLETVLEQMHADPRVELTTLGRHHRDVPPDIVVKLPEGSWGNGGGHGVWKNPRVNWTWELILPAEEEFWRLWQKLGAGDDDARRVLVAAGRQLLLASASDWAFLMTTAGAPEYATERVRGHAEDLARLLEIARALLHGAELREEDGEFVVAVEARDDLFPELEAALDAAVRDARRLATVET
jgi:1,4-alpha-glucan branching enzyme